MGLQWFIQDPAGFQCSMPLGSAYSTSNKLIQSMTLIQENKECQAALQNATGIGLRALWANISFCIDDVQLLSSTAVSEGATPSSCPAGQVQELFVARSNMLLLHESA